MALTDLTRISTSGIATGSTIDSPILRKDVSLRGSQVGVTSALFDSSDDALEFNDNVKLTFGNGGDLKLYHTGSHSYIQESGSGDLVILSNQVAIRNSAENEDLARFIENTGVQLYDGANTVRLATNDNGVVVTGILTATTFSGPTVNTSGISTFYDLRVSNNLTVEGSTTTLDTNLIGVDRVEVGANSNSIVGLAVTQSGTADILNLYDGSTEVFSVADGGGVRATGAITAHDYRSGDGVGNTLYLTSADDWRFRTTSGGEKVRITSSGTVNIGGNYSQTTHRAQITTGTNRTISFATATHDDLSDEGSGIFFSRQSDGADRISGIFQHTNMSLGVASRGGLTFHTGGNSFYSATDERLRIDSNGRLSLGVQASPGSYPTATVARQVQAEFKGSIDTGNNKHDGSLALNCTNNNANLHIIRSQNNQTSGIALGNVNFTGFDGTEYHVAAQITGARDAAGGNNNMPGRLVFLTTADGASSPTERLRITSTGLIRMGNGAEANTEASITAAIFQNVTGTATILKLGNTNTPSSANNRAIEFCDGTGGTEGSSKYTYARIKAERAGGSNSGRLIFFTKPDNSSDATEKLRIDSSGRLKVGDNVRPASDVNEGAGLRVTSSLTRNQYYSPHGHYFGSIGYTDNTNTKAWLAVDSGYAQSSAVSAGIFLSAFHQDAGGSGCGFTIKNLKDGNPLVISSVATAASTGNPAVETERLRITAGGNVEIGSGSGTGSDFSLLDGMVINTANGSAGLLINSSSSSHNAYLGFSYGSGSSTSHADQYSAYIGRVGDDTLILGAGNGIKVQIGTDGEVKCVGADDNKGFAVYTTATKKVAELIEHSADGELRLYTGADHDSSHEWFRIDAYQDDLRIGRAGTTDLTIDHTGQILFGGDITLANNTSVNFLNSSAANDGTRLTRAGGNALRLKYTGNSFIIDSLADNNFQKYR
mgnify:CR=1 FL=1